MADTKTVTFSSIIETQPQLFKITFTLKIFRNSVESLSQDFTEECSGDLFEVDYDAMMALITPRMQASIDQWKITHDTDILTGMGFMANSINSTLVL